MEALAGSQKPLKPEGDPLSDKFAWSDLDGLHVEWGPAQHEPPAKPLSAEAPSEGCRADPFEGEDELVLATLWTRRATQT